MLKAKVLTITFVCDSRRVFIRTRLCLLKDKTHSCSTFRTSKFDEWTAVAKVLAFMQGSSAQVLLDLTKIRVIYKNENSPWIYCPYASHTYLCQGGYVFGSVYVIDWMNSDQFSGGVKSVTFWLTSTKVFKVNSLIYWLKKKSLIN